MPSHISKEMSKDRIIIFAESGLLAGDLAAWLSAKYLVQRVTTEARLLQVMQGGVSALIIVQENTPPPGEAGLQILDKVIPRPLSPGERPATPGLRILLVGIDPALVPPFWRDQVTCLPAVPGPQEILTALKKSSGEAEA